MIRNQSHGSIACNRAEYLLASASADYELACTSAAASNRDPIDQLPWVQSPRGTSNRIKELRCIAGEEGITISPVSEAGLRHFLCSADFGKRPYAAIWTKGISVPYGWDRTVNRLDRSSCICRNYGLRFSGRHLQVDA